jgi:hypothetical protein
MNSIQPKQPQSDPKPKMDIQTYEFSKENKVQTIPFTALASSIRRDPGLVGIRSVPTQFWTMHSIITSMLSENNINFTEGEFHVQQNSSKAYLTDIEKADGFDSKYAPIDRWRHDKVINLIQIPGISAGTGMDIRNAAIGLTINKEGLSIAFGMNVHECSNFNVLGGTVLRTYSYDNGRSGETPWELLMHKLGKWIKGLNQIWKVQNEIMEEMKAYTLPSDIPIVEEIIGDLYIRAIKQAYFKGGVTPFDTHELSNFTKEMLQARRAEERLENVWDIYSWGTSIMKPGIVDIGEIANNSNLWADYLLDRFAMEVPEAIIVE